MGIKSNQWVGLSAAFVLGACAATTAQSVATDATKGTAAGAASVVHIGDAPMRQVGGGKATIAMLARGNNAFLGKLEMAAGGKVPEHRDATEEYIHVLAGSGTIYIEDQPSTVRPGSTVYMPANAKVRFENGAERLVAVQVFAGPAPASKYDKWQPVSRLKGGAPK